MVTAFGLVAVTVMVLTYALEARAPGYTLAFACARVLASERVELPAHMARDDSGGSCRGDRRIGAGENARWAGRINNSEMGNQRSGPLSVVARASVRRWLR
jgi:hypothetical protein